MKESPAPLHVSKPMAPRSAPETPENHEQKMASAPPSAPSVEAPVDAVGSGGVVEREGLVSNCQIIILITLL